MNFASEHGLKNMNLSPMRLEEVFYLDFRLLANELLRGKCECVQVCPTIVFDKSDELPLATYQVIVRGDSQGARGLTDTTITAAVCADGMIGSMRACNRRRAYFELTKGIAHFVSVQLETYLSPAGVKIEICPTCPDGFLDFVDPDSLEGERVSGNA